VCKTKTSKTTVFAQIMAHWHTTFLHLKQNIKEKKQRNIRSSYKCTCSRQMHRIFRV